LILLGKLFYERMDPWTAHSEFRAGLAHRVAAPGRLLGVVIPIPDLYPVLYTDNNGRGVAGPRKAKEPGKPRWEGGPAIREAWCR